MQFKKLNFLDNEVTSQVCVCIEYYVPVTGPKCARLLKYFYTIMESGEYLEFSMSA